MIKPTEKVLRAMLALQGDDNFATITEWLSEQAVRSAVDASIQKDEVMMRWAQGEYQAIVELKKTIRDARTHLSLIEKSADRSRGVQ